MAKGRAVFIRKSVGIEILLRQIFVQDRHTRNRDCRDILDSKVGRVFCFSLFFFARGKFFVGLFENLLP